MTMRQLGWGLSFLWLASCATTKSFHMARVEEQLSKAYMSSEEVSSQVQADLAEKKGLRDSLARGKTEGYKEVEPQIKNKLVTMESLAMQMLKARKQMMEARAQVTALSYSHKKITSDKPEYARVEEFVKDFEAGAMEFNTHAAAYSRESNTLAELVAQKKLYFNFEVADFQKKIARSLESARSNSKFMDQELERAQKIVSSFEGEQQTLADALYQQMANAASDYNKKAEYLSTLSSQMNNLAGGQAKIPSTSPNWKEVQQAVTDSERATFSLNELYKEFQNKTEKFRMSTKGSP